ncbi:Uncharacterised protein [uncultured archaeon]|nr:Uncharacterised protein [uncultured archaeon]
MLGRARAKGQGLVDYVIILGVVLVLALIVLALFGGWPDLALSYQNRQAVTFWRDQARPITVLEAHYRMSDRELYMSLQTQADEAFNLTALYADGNRLALYLHPVSGGETQACDVSSCLSFGCTCNVALAPHARVPIRTEPFGSGLGCQQAGRQVAMPLQMNYVRSSDGSRTLYENSTIRLVVDCQQ